MNTDIMVDIEKVCRLCLREDDGCTKMISINGNRQLVKVIQNCLQIEVILCGYEPTNICESCVHTLNTYSKFKMLCENVNAFIQSYIQEKNEPALELNSEIANLVTPGLTPSHMSDINPEFFDSDSILWNNELQQWSGDIDTARTDLTTSKCVKQMRPPSDLVFNTTSGEECMNTVFNELIEKNKNVIHTKTHCWNPKAISMRTMQKENEESISERGISKSMIKYNRYVRKTFHCYLCPEKFSKFSQLLCHDSTVHGDISKNFGCEKCGKLFLSSERLKVHELVHREKLFQCQLCQKKFAARKTLDNHLNIHFGSYSCQKCGYKAHNMKNLKVHENTHSTVKKYCCNKCEKQFAISSSLSRHDRLVHQKSDFYRCNQCDYSTIQPSCLKYHMACHFPLKFVCDSCGVWFKSEDLLTKHSKKKHSMNVQFKCSLCAKLFKSKEYLKQHITNSHDMEPKKYQCSVCENYFKNKRNLLYHINKKVCLANLCYVTPEVVYSS